MSQSTPWRPQPPSISDPEAGDSAPWEPGAEGDEGGIEVGDTPTTADEPRRPDWIKRAKDAFRFSTTYIDSNYRRAWDDSIRAFNNQHSADSKYNSEIFKKRSNLYRPKTRAVIRKNEAAAAAAYFSNVELLSVKALNEDVKEERVSADIMEQILRYRLSKSIPWFLVVLGGIQDAQVQGAAVAHVYWRFEERHDRDGRIAQKKDCPCIDLIPIENIRIDPSADWMDPIGTSPYLIHLIPMYWTDVKDRMRSPDPKGVRWKQYSPSAVFGRSDASDESTRQARLSNQQDPTQERRDISDYDIVWVHRHIHRWDGDDWQFYTIASEKLLTEPEPLRDSVWHGVRPYVMGRALVETHKPMPSSLPTLTKSLQEEANEIQNQRSDNVKFVLNKAYLVKRGKNVDLGSLVRNVPGRITLVDDPKGDVQEMNWPDVTQSAYLEQDRVDGDFNDIAGNFSPLQVNTARNPRESTNTMKMLQAPSNMLTEYLLQTYTETFVQPVLEQLMMLEQHYETDLTVLALAGQRANVLQRYGVNDVTDSMLERQLTLSVHVGIGATDPVTKLQRFVYAVMNFANIARSQPPGLDLKSVAKEMFGLTGYQDGARFMIDGVDPQVAKLMQQNAQLNELLKQANIKMQNRTDGGIVKLQSTRETNESKERIEARRDLSRMAATRIKGEQSGRELLAGHIMNLERDALKPRQPRQPRQPGRTNGASPF